MIIAISIVGLLFIVWLFAKEYRSIQFKNEVKALFNQSGSVLGKFYNSNEIIGLPEPVQRYFKLVLKEGQPLISYARIKHAGQFKTGIDKGWIEIKGEQYATAQVPGFIWKGTTSMFEAKDMYISDRGRLVVTAFSLFNIMDFTGEKYNQGELLRWLGESVLYPTNFLPSERLKWVLIDKYTARINFNYNELTLFFIIAFNEIGEIIEMQTDRYMDENHLEKWVIKVADYKEWNGVVIPTQFEVLWRLEKGDFSYAKFNITEIEYDKPMKF